MSEIDELREWIEQERNKAIGVSLDFHAQRRYVQEQMANAYVNAYNNVLIRMKNG